MMTVTKELAILVAVAAAGLALASLTARKG